MRVYGTRIKSITYNLKPICMKIYMLIFTYKNVENCFNENRRVKLTLNEVVYIIYNWKQTKVHGTVGISYPRPLQRWINKRDRFLPVNLHYNLLYCKSKTVLRLKLASKSSITCVKNICTLVLTLYTTCTRYIGVFIVVVIVTCPGTSAGCTAQKI